MRRRKFMPPQTLFTVIIFNLMILFLPVAAFLLFKWPRVWHLLLALYLGLLVGLTDLRTDDPQLPALLLITFGLFLGFAQPTAAWRWALVLGLWIPFLGLIARAAGVTNAQFSDVLFSLVALVPALIGAYAGVLVRRFTSRAGDQS
jgi:hypothetical protein